MPRGAAIALAVVTLVWLCGCGLVMQLANHGTAAGAPLEERRSFTVTQTADYAVSRPGRIAAIRTH